MLIEEGVTGLESDDFMVNLKADMKLEGPVVPAPQIVSHGVSTSKAHPNAPRASQRSTVISDDAPSPFDALAPYETILVHPPSPSAVKQGAPGVAVLSEAGVRSSVIDVTRQHALDANHSPLSPPRTLPPGSHTDDDQYVTQLVTQAWLYPSAKIMITQLLRVLQRALCTHTLALQGHTGTMS